MTIEVAPSRRSVPGLTGRHARDLLVAAGVTDRQARRVLASALVGEVDRSAPWHRYDEHTIAELAARPVLRERDVDPLVPAGLFVARRDDASRVSRWEEQRDLLAEGWSGLGFGSWLGFALRPDPAAAMPFIGTVAGFVYFGADLVSFGPHGHLDLAEPGPWYDTVRGTRVVTPPGRPWRLVEPWLRGVRPTHSE